ncbi:hypothetical protein GII33_01050 [Gordonia pseudamarae]|jgi:hypothetical protein|uniref:TPR repeat domain-containing protein n=1 Tax=Gordonia pseudamarae TaxID=2831662 RepID=A0ABX6IF12_9ACTN|nr:MULTISPECIES: hypothetical protein [Gordonia]MBD0024007.1 hypothetical protein [Gordonia sp. (in: high G+C Gram-positive bacteria)]QHN24768.1 hypothetical protein GII33_01050 [Gordonia pseudamarae]QHN33701.1 hypothetical protein GII31_01050 [Gordonia pseudamarae]
MAVPTRTQVNAFRFELLATAAQRIFDLGAQIKSDGERIQTTIAGLDWDGQGANAAELRAEDEYYEFRRAAIELEDLSEAVSSGMICMSGTANSLILRALCCEQQKFVVSDHWQVTDGEDYSQAEGEGSGDAEESTSVTATMKRRAQIAETETAQLRALAQTLADQDTTCADAITTHSAALERLTPVSSAIGGGIGDRIGDKLVKGEPLTDFERRVLAAATTDLDPRTTAGLNVGRPTAISQAEFDFLREINRDMDGLTMKEILALSDGQGPATRTNLATAVELMGCPGLRTASGDHGGMAQVPTEIRSLLTSNLTTKTSGTYHDENGTHHRVTVIDRLDGFRNLSTFIGAGDKNIQGSDINRGLAKQVSEISRATKTTGHAMGNGLQMAPDELNEFMSDTLTIAGEDKIAARDFITGKNMDVTCDNGGRYNANDHLAGLSEHRWGDHLGGLNQMFSWIGDDAGTTNPFTKTLTRDAATSLGSYLGSEEYLDTNKKLGINTPGLARIFANAVHPYLGSYVGAEGLAGIPDHGVQYLNSDELKRVFQSLNTDPEAAKIMNVEAAKWQNLMAYQYGINPDAPLAERAGMLNQAMTDGSARAIATMYDEQKEEYNQQKLIYSVVKDAGWLFPATAVLEPLLQQPVTDWVLGHEPTQDDATGESTDPKKLASLSDPYAFKFAILKGYSEQAGTEWLRTTFPSIFDGNELSWDKALKDHESRNMLIRAVSKVTDNGVPYATQWNTFYTDGQKATSENGEEMVEADCRGGDEESGEQTCEK